MILSNVTSSEDPRFRPRSEANDTGKVKKALSVACACKKIMCSLKAGRDTLHFEGLLMSTENPLTLRQTGKMESVAECFQWVSDEIVYSETEESETSCLGGLLMSTDNPFTLRQTEETGSFLLPAEECTSLA